MLQFSHPSCCRNMNNISFSSKPLADNIYSFCMEYLRMFTHKKHVRDLESRFSSSPTYFGQDLFTLPRRHAVFDSDTHSCDFTISIVGMCFGPFRMNNIVL